jgi:hypothetical protein
MKIKLLSLLIVALSLCSCKKQSEIISEWSLEPVILASGSSYPQAVPPLCAVWYKPGPVGWVPNKCFVQADELRELIEILREEVKTPNPDVSFKGSQKLSLIFYLGKPETLGIREVSFDLDKDIFIWAYGKSQKIGRILVEKQVRGDYYPNPNDPNIAKRMKEMQERLRKEAEQLKAKKEMEQKPIPEANVINK